MTVIDGENPYKEFIGDDLMQKCVSAVMQQHRDHLQGKNATGKKSVFADAAAKKELIHLDVQSFKIPIAMPKQNDRPLHPKINRLALPNTLTDSSSGVLLVTKDYPKPGNPTVSNAHFHKLLVAAGCNHLVSEIMSLSQLKAEHSELESRKELSSRIDVVLCDKALARIVPRLLGKPFLIAKKFPLAIKMEGNLKKEIERILNFTAHKMTFRNTQSALIFGHTAMPEEQLVDNLRFSLQYLCSTKFPGSWENIKALYLTVGLKGRVPLYVSTGSAKDVPIIMIMKPESEIYEGDFGFGNVKVTSTGHVLDYEPHPDDEEPIALKETRKRQGLPLDDASEHKKRKTSTKDETKSSGGSKKKGKSLKTNVEGQNKGKKLSTKKEGLKTIKAGKKNTASSSEIKFDKKVKTPTGKSAKKDKKAAPAIKSEHELVKLPKEKGAGKKKKKTTVIRSSKQSDTLPKSAQIHTTRVETF